MRGIGCCILLGALLTCPALADETRALPGMNYFSLQSLPDWSGWWSLPTPQTQEFRNAPPPMKPEDLARMRTAFVQDTDPDPIRYCRPKQFVGHSGGFVDNVEFLFTPGRVTLTNESGLLRRIYTDGRAHPADLEPSNSGHSVGHWEGQTLVVDTVGINPAAKFPAPQLDAVPIGENVRIEERISLKSANTLEIEVVTIAPGIFTAPDKRKRLYTRVPNHAAREITFCVEFDRSIDPDTGKQRFDMTPPADLAPPPPRPQ
ncbi:MAG: hypothetical protein ABI885_08970 [Gammaproteobacteria bacterium]